MNKFDPLPTFSHLRQHPEDFPAALSSPITYPDGTITVLWEGDPGTTIPMCVTEWLATPQPLEQIPGTLIWGVDLDAPPLPSTICSYGDASSVFSGARSLVPALAELRRLIMLHQ
ncbi:MAG TPA: hypothetical protein VGN34_11510 [Ktedonobacteraceae bacterium]|jgi:hypothetical protein